MSNSRKRSSTTETHTVRRRGGSYRSAAAKRKSKQKSNPRRSRTRSITGRTGGRTRKKMGTRPKKVETSRTL